MSTDLPDGETRKQRKIRELRERADRMEAAVSSQAGPSSQEYVSWERREHYYAMAAELRAEADKLEAESD